MDLNQTGTLIIDAAFTVHRSLGPGLLESAYEYCILSELIERGLCVESQVPLPLIYKNKPAGVGYRADIKVNHSVLIEIKSVEAINEVHIAQMLTYLKISNCKLGYLINFNSVKLQDGIRRIIL
jgi:GxxExxY protein